MNGLSHKQARRYMQADLDGLLSKAQRLDLQTHLSGCETCRAESEALSTLTTRLQSELHERWDLQQDGPSHNVLTNIRSQTRRIAMSNKVSFGLRALAGIVALVVLGLGLNFVISQLRDHSTPASETISPDNKMPVSSVDAKDRLLAFTKVEAGNHDIFTMRPDGSELTNITNNPAQDGYPSWSPDGRHIAFISDRDGSKQIYLMDADGSNVIQLTHGEGDYFFDPYDFSPWSPDGKRLIFSHKNPDEQAWELYVMDIDGNNVTTLTDEPGEYTSPSWSPDGEHIAFISGQPSRLPRRIFVVDKDGKDLTQLTKTLPAGENFMFSDYFWSQDGRTVIFTTDSNAGGGYNAKIYAANLDGSLTLISTSEKMVISWWNGTSLLNNSEQTFTWLRPDASQSTLDPCPDNHDLLGFTNKRSINGNLLLGSYCSTIGWTLYWANPDGTVTDKILDSILPVENLSITNATWSNDDKFIALDASDTNTPDITWTLYILDVAKARKDPSTQPLVLADSYSPSWQPVAPGDNIAEKITQPPSYDGLLAFEKMENGNLDIFTIHPDGSGLTNITNDPANDSVPTWSPDGTRILFVSDRAGNLDLFSMAPDGSNLIQLTNNPGNDGSFSWSPDGKKIVYFSSLVNDPKISIMLMNADGSEQIALTRESGLYGYVGWSPDGQSFVYQKFDDDQNSKDVGYYVVSVDNQSHPEIRFDKNSWFHWEDTEHFLYSSWNGVSVQSNDLNGNSVRPQWVTQKYDIHTAQPLVPVVVTIHDAPTVVYFENTYVVEDNKVLTWYSLDANPTSINNWNFNEHCNEQGSQIKTETGHTVSPDGTHAFVLVYCSDYTLRFYYESADGSEFKQLTTFSIKTLSILERSWSPDGKYVVMTLEDMNEIEYDLYLFDIEKMLNDPSVQPIRLTSDGTPKADVNWQPIP